jgi:hypothetical protein
MKSVNDVGVVGLGAFSTFLIVVPRLGGRESVEAGSILSFTSTAGIVKVELITGDSFGLERRLERLSNPSYWNGAP